MSEVRKRLLAIPGIGPWTTEMTMGYAYGDSDAVPVGDLHLPGMVAFALTGEESASDERMLELLQPYEGQRFRVIRLLLGVAAAPPPHGLNPNPRSGPRTRSGTRSPAWPLLELPRGRGVKGRPRLAPGMSRNACTLAERNFAAAAGRQVESPLGAGCESSHGSVAAIPPQITELAW